MKGTCTVPECGKSENCRGLCSMHYRRWKYFGSVDYVRPMPTLAERFWAKVDKSGECWVWTGVTNEFGYGQIHYEGKTSKAHRVAWVLTHGEPPSATPCVLHRCDNPPCVRPDHLFLGTIADNAQDMVAKGRGSLQRPEAHPTGIAHHNAKLTDEDVAAIRALRHLDRPQRLGPLFNVTPAHIRQLWRGDARAHIPAMPVATALDYLRERTAS